MASYESIRLINTILTLYYLEEMTQTEIAQRLGFSTAKVNRLLLQAREQGYVNITIKTPFQQLFELEERLKPTCVAAGPAVAYLGWDDHTHSFRFLNRDYADRFVR